MTQTSFGEQVIAVLEFQTRRWRYWSELWEVVKYMHPDMVEIRFGWTKARIEAEMHLALSDMLFW